VRRALVGGRPELLPVFGEVSFADSTPAPGETDGADASNFAHTVDWPFPVLYRGAVTQAMALPESPTSTPSTRAPRRGSCDRACDDRHFHSVTSRGQGAGY
jgi:hypothetical protein